MVIKNVSEDEFVTTLLTFCCLVVNQTNQVVCNKVNSGSNPFITDNVFVPYFPLDERPGLIGENQGSFTGANLLFVDVRATFLVWSGSLRIGWTFHHRKVGDQSFS